MKRDQAFAKRNAIPVGAQRGTGDADEEGEAALRAAFEGRKVCADFPACLHDDEGDRCHCEGCQDA